MGPVESLPPAGADRPGVGLTFLRLGLVSFGGPVAHIGYIRDEVVGRRRWLVESQYADLVALAQFLPGPASSQVGIGVGLLRSGLPGSLRSWLGFTTPSAALMIGAGVALGSGGVHLPDGVLSGLEVAAAAVVALAVVQMARALCRGWVRAALALAVGAAVLLVPGPFTPVVAMAVAGLAGVVLLRDPGPQPEEGQEAPAPRMPPWVPTVAISLFVALLVLLPAAARMWPGTWTTLIAGCYRAGALVFGGGHVVLPLLQDVAVGSGALDQGDFVAGYGLANALPGPLFTFAGYVGAAAGGAVLGLACLMAIFLPGYLLVVAALGHWHRARGRPRLRQALSAVNAAVVGLLAAALYDPVLVTAVTGWAEAAMAALAFVALARFQVAPHLLVVACALGEWLVLG
jgi:chromate transporter